MTPAPDQPPEEARGRVLRAALVRPMALLMVGIGGITFAATLAWWIVPLTLATYASLVFLAVQDPAFRNRVLGTGEQEQLRIRDPRRPRLSPEQRARRLPRGATREKVEAALEAHGRVLVAVEESDERTRATLDGTLAKLRRVPERLLNVAEAREEAAAKARVLRRSRTGSPESEQQHAPALASLEEKLRAADAEIFGAPDELLALRAKVVRAGIEGGEALGARAAEIDEALDALNLRLDALCSTMVAPPDGR